MKILYNYIISLFLISLGYLNEFKMIFITMTVLIIADLLTAIIKSIKEDLNKYDYFGIKGLFKFIFNCFLIIKSNKLRKTALKMLLYYILIICAALIQKEILSDWVNIVKLTASIICLSEFVSILENINITIGNNIFTGLIKIIKDKFVNLTSKKVSDN